MVKQFSFFNLQLESPWFLVLFLLFIPLIFLDISKKKKVGIPIPTISGMNENRSILLVMYFLKISKYFILASLFIALARPRTYTVFEDRDDTKGVDIILSVDVSLSMLARDLDPDRIRALQKIAIDFVSKRPNDRIGLVTYSGEAFTKVPLTTDHQVVIDELANLKFMELADGTAIGEGLSVAVNHLKHSKSKSKIIILMTDGVNTILNAMDPQIAAQLAKEENIKVYSIGIGSNGYALMPTQRDIFGDLIFNETEVKIDEVILGEIAQRTGGKYFRATSNQSLEKVYEAINQLEKSEVKTNKNYHFTEYFRYFVGFALLVLVVDALLRWVIFKFLS